MTDHKIDSLRDSIKAVATRIRREQPAVQGITRTQLHVLTLAERSGMAIRPGQIASDLQMTTANVATALRELEALRLITRYLDQTDGRHRLIAVTDLGRRAVAETRRARHAWFNLAIEDALSEEERRLLFEAGRLLQRLADHRPLLGKKLVSIDLGIKNVTLGEERSTHLSRDEQDRR